MESLKQWLTNGFLSSAEREWLEQEKKREIKCYIKGGYIVTDIPSLVNSAGFKRQMEAVKKIFGAERLGGQDVQEE